MVIHPSYYDACYVSCDVTYYFIAVRARRMVHIFFLPCLGNRSKLDPCSYELFCLESYILSFPKVLQIPPESPCMFWSHVVCCVAHFFKPLHAYVCAQVLICAVGQSKPARTLGLEVTPRGPAHSEWPFVLPLQPKVVSVHD